MIILQRVHARRCVSCNKIKAVGFRFSTETVSVSVCEDCSAFTADSLKVMLHNPEVNQLQQER